MATALDDFLKAGNAVISAVGGGPGKVDAQALTLGAVSEGNHILNRVSNNIGVKLTALGRRIGQNYGTLFTDSLAAGASQGAGRANLSEQRKIYGVTYSEMILIAGALLVGIFIFARKI